MVAALGGVSRGALETLSLDGRGSLTVEAASVFGPTRAAGLPELAVYQLIVEW